MFKELYKGLDSINNKAYKAVSVNAVVLSSYLKERININDYIIKGSYINDVMTDLKEIYEYQNFFLIEKDDEYILLDGFRRLLTFNVPDNDITVRIYNYNDFNEKELLTLLINLNQPKFITNLGFYYDRGVCMALHKLFGINISKYHKVLDGYLRQEDIVRSYTNIDKDNSLLLNRITDDFFIKNMKEIEKIFYSKSVHMNSILGTLIYNYSNENNKIIDSNKFIEMVKNDDAIQELHKKIAKVGDNNNANSFKEINKLTESYVKIFNILSGKKVEETFNEKQLKFKEIITSFKKNKDYTKITNNREIIKLENYIHKRLKNKFKLFIHPIEKDYGSIGYGECDYEIIVKNNEKIGYRNPQKIDLYIVINNKEYKITHNYSRYGRTNAYTSFNIFDSKIYQHNIEYKIELFVDISKKDFNRIKNE